MSADLQVGTEIEREHAGIIAKTGMPLDEAARRIAADHLKEREDYYDGMNILEGAPQGFWRVFNSWTRIIVFIILLIFATHIITAKTSFSLI